MRYPDGSDILPGDVVSIDIKDRGTVIANMDKSICLPGHEHWMTLGKGIMVDTDFGGLVHYESDDCLDEISLIRRPQN